MRDNTSPDGTSVNTSSKNFNLSYDELFNLLKEAYRNGYATYEMVESGLESYDAEGYSRWVLLGLRSSYL